MSRFARFHPVIFRHIAHATEVWNRDAAGLTCGRPLRWGMILVLIGQFCSGCVLAGGFEDPRNLAAAVEDASEHICREYAASSFDELAARWFPSPDREEVLLQFRNFASELTPGTRPENLQLIDLVQGAGDSKGLLALLPVYRRGGAADGAGRDQLEGLVLLVIRTTELLQEALPPHQAARSLLMHFELVDEDAGGTPQVIGTSTGGEREVALTSWTCQESLDVGNQRWRLIGRPTEEFMAGQLTRWPLIVGVGVFLCWEVLGGLALSLLIWQRDASLRRQARVYEAAFRDLVEGVVVADPNGKFLLFNPAAERLLGIGSRNFAASRRLRA